MDQLRSTPGHRPGEDRAGAAGRGDEGTTLDADRAERPEDDDVDERDDMDEREEDERDVLKRAQVRRLESMERERATSEGMPEQVSARVEDDPDA